MKAVFAGKSGKLETSDVGDKHQLIELSDGVHPIPKKAIFRPRDADKDSLVFYFSDSINPYLPDKDALSNAYDEVVSLFLMITAGNTANEEVNVNTQLERKLGKYVKYVPFIAIGLVVLFSGVL